MDSYWSFYGDGSSQMKVAFKSSFENFLRIAGVYLLCYLSADSSYSLMGWQIIWILIALSIEVCQLHKSKSVTV
jgi:hypothetical protein